MTPSIAVFGVGPGLGQAIARRYAREGYAVVLVARRQEPLDLLAKDLTRAGATAHVVTADLSDTDTVPRLAGQIRGAVGDPSAFYYGVPAGGFLPVAALTPARARALMPLALYTLLALVQEFLPAMLERADGAILSAQGGSAVEGRPHIAGGVALAAQRNYLQALHAAVADKGVYVGGLYIGAAIEHSAFHTEREAAKAAGEPVGEMPTVDPAHLAELLWTMHRTRGQPEATYPAR
jgi:short-subunit dehydrogenase